MVDTRALWLRLASKAAWVSVRLQDPLLATADVGICLVVLLSVHVIEVHLLVADIDAIELLLGAQGTLAYHSAVCLLRKCFSNLGRHLIILLFQLCHL